jgi:hypothetical protein
MKHWLILSAVVLLGLIGGAQSQQPPVTVIGSVTPGHCTSFASTLQLQDAGAACGGSGVSVTSVFGRMGVVVAQPNDYTLSQIAPGTVAATGGTIASTAITGGTISSTAITGGNIDGTVIGGTTRAAGSFSSVAITTPLPVTSGGTGDSGTAWTPFTLAPVCGGSTYTITSARFKTLGKTTFVEGNFLVTGVGSCTDITISLPNTANSSGTLAAINTARSIALGCVITGPNSVAECVTTSTYLVNDRIIFSGVYENQ